MAAAACLTMLGPGSAPRPFAGAAAAGSGTAFTETTVLTGLTEPTAFRFAPDGRVFVAEKSGLIKVFQSLHAPTPTVFADLRTNVYNYWDRGLLGLELDPQFPVVPYVYVLYTYDHILGDPAPAPRWGSPGETVDPCPTPPGPTVSGCLASGRLSRLQAAGSVITGDEHVLVEDWCQQFPGHAMGDLAFGPDGALYASAGEGASFSAVDYGQAGNPCGDPGGPTPTPPTAEGGALRSQDLRSAEDPVGLSGSVIRVSPATGEAAAGSPLAGDADPNARRIIAYGLRNPFRVAFRPGTRELWVGDVGLSAWEEIDRITDPTGSVLNFGWPCFEGGDRQAGFESVGLALCQSLYAGPGAVTAPYFAYHRAASAGEPCQGRPSVAGVSFEYAPTGGQFPPEFAGALFFADDGQKCIWVMRRGADGVPEQALVEPFMSGVADPVDLHFGPDGALYYADYSGGTIRRIAPASTAGSTPDYPSRADYATGTGAHGVVVAHLDHDGKPDLAVANAGSSTVTVLRGNGDGTFRAATSAAVGSQPKSVAAADLDGDGNIDLVTANQGSNTVSVLRGDGSGSVGPSVDFPVCAGAHEVAVGQFDGNAVPDLAVACWGGSVVSVLLGKGGATFGPATSFAAGSAPHSLVVHDFDFDGRPDLAVANHASGDVSILRGSGAGAFSPPVDYAVGSGPHSIRLGDFDGDGIADLVTANDGSDSVTVLRGAADGTFPVTTDYPAGRVPKGLAVADLNGDGLLDVVTADTAGRYPAGGAAPGGDRVSLLLGSGTGAFSPPQQIATGDAPFAVAVARLDADGRPDLVTANWFGNGATVLLSSAPTSPVPLPPPPVRPPSPPPAPAAAAVVPPFAPVVATRDPVTRAVSASKPRSMRRPSISGVARVGKRLRARDGRWKGKPRPTLVRLWLRCRTTSAASCVPIAGATSRSYVMRRVDLGRRLRIRVTAANSVARGATSSAPTSKVRAGKRRR